jgi:hypothetical protein
MIPLFIATVWFGPTSSGPTTRKREILRTIEHIYEQQIELESNATRMDLNALQRRREFLAELLSWYERKLRDTLESH